MSWIGTVRRAAPAWVLVVYRQLIDVAQALGDPLQIRELHLRTFKELNAVRKWS